MKQINKIMKGYRTFIVGILLVFLGYKVHKDELGALGSGILIARYNYLKNHKNDEPTED